MTLSRRELVSLLLGTPVLAALSCSPQRRQFPPAGRLYGQSFDLGHRIRDSLIDMSISNHDSEDIPIVIVGGGIAGLSAGWRLQNAGHSGFVLLEMEDDPGGTSRSSRSELTEFPWGAHYLPVPLPHNRDLIGLLQEMELVESIDELGHPRIFEQHLCREPEERLLIQGKWIEGLYPTTGASQRDLDEWQTFRQEIDRWVTWRDAKGRRAFTIPIAFASDDPAVLDLDQITMDQWLNDRGFQSDRLRWVVDYSCRDDYGLSSNETSAWAG
ncbi:MAG: FAD-dependent oxidoreductase, partial [Planctomycetes bacterium]|nr:FAD-dependent oxidoreductase [Planctomycetota bacterium]